MQMDKVRRGQVITNGVTPKTDRETDRQASCPLGSLLVGGVGKAWGGLTGTGPSLSFHPHFPGPGGRPSWVPASYCSFLLLVSSPGGQGPHLPFQVWFPPPPRLAQRRAGGYLCASYQLQFSRSCHYYLLIRLSCVFLSLCFCPFSVYLCLCLPLNFK